MNEHVNISISSTMSRMNDLCKNLHVDSWEFYNFLVSGYPSIEINHPCFFMKYFDETFIGTPVGDFDEMDLDMDDIPYYDFKKDTRRWDIRDKARAGHKGKKINDANGEHWTNIYMTNPKKKKAMKKQVETDIQNMKENKEFDYPTLVNLCGNLYKMVKSPAIKHFHEVLSEVLDFCTFLDLDSYTLEIIENEVFSYYKRDVKEMNNALNCLDDTIRYLKEAQQRVELYIELLSTFGINMTDKEA